MKYWGVWVLAAVTVLSGCATLSEEECMTADWYSIGYEDGANGQSETRIGSHREACAKHGVTPDLRDYQDGHDEGLLVFCTSRNGFNRARSGYQYNGICPPSLEPEFLDGYEAGRQIYQVASEVSNLEGEQLSNEAEQQRIEQQLLEKEAALFGAGTPEEQRRVIYEEIALLKERQGTLEQQRDDIIRDLANSESRLRELRNRYSYY
ncbi:DUF2799 domain-containing protein [Saccharospirillum impatiens]|jgi:hypothetical protein|uniref:DUF2799 domain-containing protein n=1 Tax=Saccharospirillum impatiens TaxID=169438 RepID=UPI0003F998C0|nr:DUF2799 domain-containing protein [Saccharospirillum impatiens]